MADEDLNLCFDYLFNCMAAALQSRHPEKSLQKAAELLIEAWDDLCDRAAKYDQSMVASGVPPPDRAVVDELVAFLDGIFYEAPDS